MDPFTEYIHPDAQWEDALAELLGAGGGGSTTTTMPGDPLMMPAFDPGMAFTADEMAGFGTAFGFSGNEMVAFEGGGTTSPASVSAGTTTEGGESSPAAGEMGDGGVVVRGEGSMEGEVGWGVVGEGWGVAPGLLGLADPALLAPKLPLQYSVDVVAPAPARAPAPAPSAKLHNKVEKRYRYNVKNALETLRDSVPRLRQVYGTSLPIELATTDQEDPRGLMGGLEPLGKPTKKTVMLGARLYIEHLETEQRVQAVRIGRAEEALRARMKSDEWARWMMETEHQAARVRDEYGRLLEDKTKIRAAAAESGTADPDAEDDEDEDVRPKKRARADDKKPPRQPAARKPRSSVTSTTSQSSSSTAATAAFYSFGLAYVLFPRATEWFGYRPDEAAAPVNATARGKVLLPSDAPGVPLASGWSTSTAFDIVGILALGFVIMACVYALTYTRRAPADEQTSDDDEPQERVETEQVIIRRLGRRLGLGTPGGLVSELVRRIPFLREETISSSASRDWYKVYSAYVGGGVKFGRLATLHIRLRLARTADEERTLAVLYALQSSDATRQDAWNKARKLVDTENESRAIQDVSALALPEAERWLHQVEPTTRPVEDIANQLVLEDLDRVLTHLYVSLVAASYPVESPGNQLAVLVDNMSRSSKATQAVLADSAFKARIQRILTGVEKESESHVLGLVVIGLWGHLIGQEATRQRALANMLIAQQVQRADGTIGSIQSVDLLLALILPGYKNPKNTARRPQPKLSQMAQELDTIAAVCLRYLLLLRSVSQLAKPDAPRHQRLRSSVYVRQACLEIRMLLAQPAFDTRVDAETSAVVSSKDTRALGFNAYGHPVEREVRTPQDEQDETEDAEFAWQTDRLIDLMTIVGCRAASRAGGRDDDSGVEGDLEEL